VTASLEIFVPDALWLGGYAVSLGGARINARMTVIKLSSGELLIHSPCEIDEAWKAEIAALGPVAAIIAPGNFHWLHVASCQQAFPDAATYICPGVEKRAGAGLVYDHVLADQAPALWAGQLSQVVLQGTRLMREVGFFHHASKTLILVDLIENVTAATPDTNWFLRVFFRAIGMWNRPSPAPEYRFGWGDKKLVRAGMEQMLAWDFERVIVSHGDVITTDAKRVVAHAWRKILGPEGIATARPRETA
jgi:hypothetical protein